MAESIQDANSPPESEEPLWELDLMLELKIVDLSGHYLNLLELLAEL
jgi:hypothetical protein